MHAWSNRKRITLPAFSAFAVALLMTFLSHNSLLLAGAVPPQTSSKDIIFGKLKPYDHKSGWFAISFPENWTVKDGSFGDQTILTSIDETTNGALVVRAYPSKDLTQSEITVAINQYIRDTMAALPGFTMGDTVSNADGSAGIVFHYDQALGLESHKMYGEVVMKQHNGILGLFLFLLPQDQVSSRLKSAYEVRATFHIIGKPKT